MERSVACDFLEKVERRGDGKSDVDEIGIAQSGGEIAREGFVHGAAGAGFLCDLGAIPAGDAHSLSVLAQGEGEGAADEAGAENGDAADEVSGHERTEFTVES